MYDPDAKDHLLTDDLPDAFAYHQILHDNEGNPVDYRFLDVNPAFEHMTGLVREEIVGRRVTEVLPGIEDSGFDWIGTFGRVASTGAPIRFENYSEPLGRWYEVTAYSPNPGYFVALFRDTTLRKRETQALETILGQLHRNLRKPGSLPDYQNMTDDLLELSGAQFVALNTYEEAGTKTVTRAISGMTKGMHRASEIVGFELVGKAWDIIPERAKSIRDGRLIRFENLYEAGSGAIGRSTARILERLFDLGPVYVVELSDESQSIGDFILFMSRGGALENPRIVELYANQSGILIQRNRMERILRATEEQFRTLAEHSPDLITRVDREGRRLYTNPAVETVLGFRPEDAVGKTNRELGIEHVMTSTWEHAIAEVFRTGMPQSVEAIRSNEDQDSFYLIRLVPEFDEEGAVATVLSISRDITDQKRTEQQIRWVSFHDSLTGLYNRRFLDEEMLRLDTERQLPLSVIMADLNGLKLVNDTYGHAAGDEMLRMVGEILEKACRSEDILGRWGGDEFLLLLPQTDGRGAESVCGRIAELSEGARTRQEIPISLSVGHATKTRFDQRIETVVMAAEDEMYQRKLIESKSQKSELIDMLLKTIAGKSFETQRHTARMREYALRIGEDIGLTPYELHCLGLAVNLHDVGKITIPEEILLKRDPLTESEWRTVEKHPETGYRIARSTDGFAHVADDILHHHERWDGTGYPVGLAGESIPLRSRIIAVVDAFDAITNERSYRMARSPEEALLELEAGAGTQFDPHLVEVFTGLYTESGSPDSEDEC